MDQDASIHELSITLIEKGPLKIKTEKPFNLQNIQLGAVRKLP